MKICQEHGIELIVLARYMQILSKEAIEAFNHPIINIHHSFLPAFAGAKPYHQAYERGVKVIGATSHYVTEHLDDGPIITQNVLPISHRAQTHDLIRIGEDLEKTALAQAVRLHALNKTMIYKKGPLFLNNHHFLLHGTQHPGNMGAAARAIKSMGFSNLYFLNPQVDICQEALSRATHASDLLTSSCIYQDLSPLDNCDLIFALSARSRHLDLAPISLKEAILKTKDVKGNIGWLFGCERSGLPNELMLKAHRHVYIPTATPDMSLNLAQAIQIVAYECAHAPNKSHRLKTLASQKSLTTFFLAS